MTCQQMMDSLNATFGTSLTRNAIIGKIGRLGLSNPPKVKVRTEKPKRNKGGEHRTIMRIVAMNGNSTVKKLIYTTEFVKNAK